MDKLTAIKIKYDDGTYSDEIPISAFAENVEWDSSYSLVDILGEVAYDTKGSIQDQISQLFNEKIDYQTMMSYINSSLGPTVTNWLNENVNPVGSAVVVDKALEIENAAADAKITGLLAKNIPFYNYLKAFTSRTSSSDGIFTLNNDGSVSINGTTTGTTWFDYIPTSANNFPSILEKDVKYQIDLYNNHNDSLSLRIYYYHNSGELTFLAKTPDNKSFTIPNDATGLLIRLHVMGAATINETVYPVFSKQYPFYSSQVQNIKFKLDDFYTDANDIFENSVVFVSIVNDTLRLRNLPNNRAGFLCTYCVANSNLSLQIYYPYDLIGYNNVKFRIHNTAGTWGDWYDLVDTRTVNLINPKHIWANYNLLQNKVDERHGLTFTWSDNITCKITGTASTTNFYTFYNKNMADVVSQIAGKTMTVFFKSENI